MTTFIPINYKKKWANIYILVGVICVLIFSLGYFIVNDFMILVYSIASIVPIYFGYKMKKSPYALVSKSNIEVFGLFGELKYEYICTAGSKFINRENKIFLIEKNKTTRIKMNKWFVNQADWNAVLDLFD